MPKGSDLMDTHSADVPEVRRKIAELGERTHGHAHPAFRTFATIYSPDVVALGTALSIVSTFVKAQAAMAANPFAVFDAQLSLWNNYTALCQRTAQRCLGGQSEPVVEAAQG